MQEPIVEVIMLKGEKGDKGEKGEKGDMGDFPIGGTAGQVLMKKSNENYAYEWKEIAPVAIITNAEIDNITG